MSNLKFAVRSLLKTPFVTAVAVSSLALGIGANVAIFSLFHQMLLRPLPVDDPGRLVNLSAPGPKPGNNSCNQAGSCEEVFSYPMFRDVQRDQKTFTGIAAHRVTDANLSFKGQTTNGECALVSGTYFPLLGVRPALGRLLGPQDDKAIGESPVVVLGYDYWSRRFGEQESLLGRTMIVNGQAMTIVGIAPRGFRGTTLGSNPDVYVPITMRGVLRPRAVQSFTNRRDYWTYLFARLKPGVTLEQARAAVNVPYASILNDVEAPLQKEMSDQTLRQFRARKITVVEGAKGQSRVSQGARQPLSLLLGVTALVLLIACANIANLLLARGATRSGEIAVRLAIGAGRRHIIGRLLTESCLLSVAGGAAGLLVARWTLHLMASMLPAEALNVIDVQLDGTVLLFAAALALGTGLLFGLFPALHVTRPDLAGTLKGQAGQPSGARSAKRFRTALATAQIALSMALLVAAGLFTKSLINVSRVDLGIRADNVLTFGISPSLNGYNDQRSMALYERVESDLRALPGVVGVTAAEVPLLANSNWTNDVSVEGFAAGPDTDVNSWFNAVGAGHFRTLGQRLLAGRDFTMADAANAPKVAIVNQQFAKKFNLGRNPIGKRVAMNAGKKPNIEIVGVVQDAKYSQVKEPIPPQYFIPYRQDTNVGALTFYVRTALDPEQTLPSIRKLVARLDPNLPVERLRTMPEQVRENVFIDRFITTLSTAFAILATLLAAIGLYGVLAYTVAQRTREIGLRMALGADGGRVRAMILRHVGWMTLVGGAIGLAAAMGIGQGAQALLFELKGRDSTVLALSAVVLALVSLVAGFIPAYRASRIDPMKALRYE